jgi:hypothetical protein
MEQYTIKLKTNLRNFEKTYDIKYDEYIEYYILKLDKIESELKKLQKKEVDKSKAENSMKNILNELKDINNKIKVLLKEKKEIYTQEVVSMKEKY